MIMGHADQYSAEETKILDEGEKLFAMFNGLKWKKLEMVSPLASAKIAFKSGDQGAWGWASITVRASPEEVLAFLWETLRRSSHRADDLEKSVEEEPNGHNQLVYRRKRIKVIADRDFLRRKLWRRDGEGTLVLVTNFEESANRPARSDTVRGRFPSVNRIKRVNNKETTLEYVMHPDFGGAVPSFVLNYHTAKNLAAVTSTQEYFQAMRGLEEWDGNDGRAVGEAMCIKTKAEKNREKGESRVGARMRRLFERHAGLKQIAEKHEFFLPMMTRIVENKLRSAAVVNSQLCSLSKNEGRAIGRGLALATNLTAEAGVDEYILKYRSLRELDKTEAWFRPMLNVVGKRLLGEVSWGLKTRVLMGAGLSVMDVATDIFVIVGYMGKEETRGYGYSLMGMVVGSMVLQLLLVFVQHRKRPLKMLGEMLIVLTGLKPGFDAKHVCSGKEMDENSVMDAKTELLLAKCSEMFCESIPGCLLQQYVLLKQRELVDRATVGSVLISAMTTGFSSASMSFDKDVDPASRKYSPDFYGYIPDGNSRTLIFGCMLLNSALLLLIRSFSAAVLMLVKKRYFMLFWAGDMALYLLQKVARRDFYYWIPVDGVVVCLRA